MSRAEAVKAFARTLGFDPVGITTAEDFAETERLTQSRLAAGLLAGLPWLTPARVQQSCRPRDRFLWARSIISLAFPYRRPPVGGQSSRLSGVVSRYAWGVDYHRTIGDKLSQLAQWLGGLDRDVITRPYVDAGRLPDRAVAVRAGLGWFGKHTNVITRRHGSWVFLAELITSLDLAPDQPLRRTCGSCTTCLRACPTAALVGPYVLDTARCISFLTIELRGGIPRDLRPRLGNMVFGCDLCQESCPVNARLGQPADPLSNAFPSDVGCGLQRPPCTGEASVQGTDRAPSALPSQDLDLVNLLTLDDEAFRQRFRHTALWRAHRLGLQRNALVVLGNLGDRAAVPVLAARLAGAEPLLRAHAAWALGRLGGRPARAALERALAVEVDPVVCSELDCALNG